eukprot:6232349-Alexandrium_andersonii.AAC.1
MPVEVGRSQDQSTTCAQAQSTAHRTRNHSWLTTRGIRHAACCVAACHVHASQPVSLSGARHPLLPHACPFSTGTGTRSARGHQQPLFNNE